VVTATPRPRPCRPPRSTTLHSRYGRPPTRNAIRIAQYVRDALTGTWTRQCVVNRYSSLLIALLSHQRETNGARFQVTRKLIRNRSRRSLQRRTPDKPSGSEGARASDIGVCAPASAPLSSWLLQHGRCGSAPSCSGDEHVRARPSRDRFAVTVANHRDPLRRRRGRWRVRP